MIDLDLKLTINKEKTSAHKSDFKDFANTQSNFEKVFENVSKSFEANKKSIENYNKKKSVINNSSKEKIKIKNKDKQNDNNISYNEKNSFSHETQENDNITTYNENLPKEQLINNQQETQNKDITAEFEGIKPEINNLPQEKTNIVKNEQINHETKEFDIFKKLLCYQKSETSINKLTEKNAQEAKVTSEKLLNTKTLIQKTDDTLKIADNKLLAQNPPKILNSSEHLLKSNSENLVKTDKILNLQNTINTALKTELETALANNSIELDIEEVKINNTKSSLDNQLSQNQNEFNFNSSSFTDLQSHVTKLSLNKTADFSKVMNTKTVQQDNQILNQVKEATSNTLSKGTTNVSIILRPEHLGRVQVNLLSQNGVLTAHLTTQTQQTADTLTRNIETLKQNLIDQGLKVNEVIVKIQESSNNESLMNNNQSSEDKLGQTKDQYQSFKENRQNKFDDNFENKRNNLVDEEKIEYITSQNNSNINNDLELYNNMGRTL